MSRSIRVLWVMGALALLSGCASNRPARELTPTSPDACATASADRRMMPGNANGMMGEHGKGMMDGGMMSSSCPMTVPGTSAAIADTEDGIALTFTTTKPDEVTELRARVKRMADMHAQGGMMGGGMMGGGMMGGGMMGGGKGMMDGGPMPSSTATTEEVDGGARLVFKPKDAAQLQSLREHVKQHAAHMQQGQCSMMRAYGGSDAAK